MLRKIGTQLHPLASLCLFAGLKDPSFSNIQQVLVCDPALFVFSPVIIYMN